MGSLFKARDFWSTRVASNEEFDHGLFTTLRDADGVKLVVGSHQGVLRVFAPKRKGYKPEDLLCEVVLGAPILQLATGSFGNRERSLVVLTPRRVLVGGLNAQPLPQGAAADKAGDPMSRILSLSFDQEHHLEHTSYNMVVGPFGGGKSVDQICVQSMDGQLAFFGGAGLLFSRYLPSNAFLCPGRLLYVPSIDAFVTGTSTFELQCYRFSSLAHSTASETKDEGSVGKKVTPDWVLNIGEDIVDLCWARFTRNLPNQQLDIIVLGEHTLYVVKQDTGELRSNRRMDCHPSCVTSYLLPDKSTHNLLIGTHDQQIIVMGEAGVLWSAKTPSVPLSLHVGPACKVDGMVLMLALDGTLGANYLGTDPANDPVQLLESKEFDYDAMDEEQRRLQQIIRQAVNSSKTEPREVINIQCDTPTMPAPRMCQVVATFSFNGEEDVENVTVTVHCQEPIVAAQHTQVIQLLPRREHLPVPFQFIAGPEAERMTPTSLLVDIVACYQLRTGDVLTSKAHVVLPLGLLGTACPPVKSNAFVVQIDTDQAAPSLADLFSDLRSGDVQPNLLSFQYFNGADATVLASKNGGRYRVQSNLFSSLWIMCSELTRRLKAFYQARGVAELQVTIPDPIPLPAYMTLIDAHFDARKQLAAAQQELNELAHQFRAVQKRLLVRFRDKNPAPLSSLESLFEMTYHRLGTGADSVDAATRVVEQQANLLRCGTQTVLFLARYRFAHFTKEDIDILRHYLSPTVHRSANLGWEEVTDAALTYLLRTVLSKNSKEAATAPAPMVTPDDTSKLKKHLTIVFDRIEKGATLREQSKKDTVTVVEGKRGSRAPQAV